MRLAHYIQRYPPALGGSEAYFARLSRYCAAAGDDVTVFTSNALALEAFWSPQAQTIPVLPGERDADVAVRRYPLWRMRGRRWLLKPLSLVPNRLWQCLTLPCNPISLAMWHDAGHAPVAFDAVHASAFPYAFPIACAWRLARRLQVPFFVTPFLHLGDPADPHDGTRRSYLAPPFVWLLREADGIFVQTPSEREAVLGLGIPPAKVILQGLGVEPADCTGGDRFTTRERWQLTPETLAVGHLANLSHEKGTTDLLAAMEALWRQGSTARLVLAGPEMPNFRKAWHAFEQRCPEWAQRHVQRLGILTEKEKRDFFAAIDVFALPSRSDSFGLVLLEAWANGVPNVAYRAGGIADVIRDGTDGLLAPCGDICELARALNQVATDPSLRDRLGRAGLHRLPIDFDWNAKLHVVRATLAEFTERNKKARTEPTARTLPTLRSIPVSE